jgi:tocopherol cyclase
MKKYQATEKQQLTQKMKPIEKNIVYTGDIKNSRVPGIYDIKKIWNPSWFQGNRKKNNYFEGWYFKVISHDHKQSWAFIPGISLSKNDEHSFVQAINGKTGNTWYFRYPLNEFNYSKTGFHIHISGNFFSSRHMILNLESDDIHISGSFSFERNHIYKASLSRPGIMGWYRYVPFMECYHGVVSLHHHADGRLQVNDQEFLFINGKGYIEKDWGSSMPKAWLWMQSNHFDRSDTSFMLSVARIPWVGNAFTGFLGFFLYQGRRYDFATYTGTRLKLEFRKPDTIYVEITHKNFTMTIESKQGMAGMLKAPVSGQMQRIIHESIDANIHVNLNDTRNNIHFSGIGTNAGLELVGDYQLLSL